MSSRWPSIVLTLLAIAGVMVFSRLEAANPAPLYSPQQAPTLTDFWEGRATWQIDVADTGLPIGESDTLHIQGDEYWSYLHASYPSAGIVDSCGDPVAFPGCVTRWVSTDGGVTFSLSEGECMLECRTCPCSEDDRVWQQQYPRVERDRAGVFHMIFEHGAAAYYTFSFDGIQWVRHQPIRDTGVWQSTYAPCKDYQRIQPHPFTSVEYDCMQGGPPGFYIEDDRMYLYVGQGQSPGHMGCLWSTLSVPDFFPCFNNPILSSSRDYGPFEALGAQANPYWDFRYITSGDILKDGDYYYMVYEGIRGPASPAEAGDTQFALGMARSTALDAKWEPYPHNPIVDDVSDNVGIGHADLIVIDGVTMMYTASPDYIRARYALVWASMLNE